MYHLHASQNNMTYKCITLLIVLDQFDVDINKNTLRFRFRVS